MKIVVIGGTGLIGSRLVSNLRDLGHEAIAASPRSGVNAVTGEGLSAALTGAEVVVDVSNSPSFEDKAVLEFFEKSTSHLLAAEAAAGVRHHVALSVVGAERLHDSGYMRAKLAQEALIKAGGIPYTILRATQFFEFLDAIAMSSLVGETFRVPSALIQPVAARDVSAVLTEVALAAPQNTTLELGGPQAYPFSDIIRRHLTAKGDAREVVADPNARYFGERLEKNTLTSTNPSFLGSIDFEQWLKMSSTVA